MWKPHEGCPSLLHNPGDLETPMGLSRSPRVSYSPGSVSLTAGTHLAQVPPLKHARSPIIFHLSILLGHDYWAQKGQVLLHLNLPRHKVVVVGIFRCTTLRPGDSQHAAQELTVESGLSTIRRYENIPSPLGGKPTTLCLLSAFLLLKEQIHAYRLAHPARVRANLHKAVDRVVVYTT